MDLKIFEKNRSERQGKGLPTRQQLFTFANMYRILAVSLLAIALSSCQAKAAPFAQAVQEETTCVSMEQDEVSTTSGIDHEKTGEKKEKSFLQAEGATLCQRYRCPEGYERIQSSSDSFAFYLQNLPLKPYGEKVLYFDGREKPSEGIYDSVVAMEIGDRDLHQCADAIMLLRGDYLRKAGRSDEIAFHFVDGFEARYKTWKNGKRILVKGNTTKWVDGGTKGDSDASFRKYMNMVFAYAGTPSLEKELKKTERPVEIGDVWIQGGSPGHGVIVVDVAEKKSTGERVFILAQSYMPAQETQILLNPKNASLSPWYFFEQDAELETPQWHFGKGTRRQFPLP